MILKKKAMLTKTKYPEYCDFSCKFANFSNPEVSGACRKDLSVWCTHFNKFNNKNGKCIFLK